MVNRSHPSNKDNKSITYQVKIKSLLTPEWSKWFDEMTIIPTENGETIIAGPTLDQSALIRLLKKLQNLGLPLISVTQNEEFKKEE